MNIIECVKNIISNCPGITDFCNAVAVDFTKANEKFGLSSNGDTLSSSTIKGNELWTHSFVLYANNQSFTDFDRLANSTFFHTLTHYLKTAADHQPITVNVGDITYNATIERIYSSGAMSYGASEDGMTINYQIQIYATYLVKKGE